MPSRLRSSPRTGESLVEPRRDAADREPLLCERVAVAHGDRLVLERLLVDRERPRRPDLVLAAVAAADLPAVVVLDGEPPAQLLEERARAGRHALVARDQRE